MNHYHDHPVQRLREAVHDHVLRNTIFSDAAVQAQKQRDAVLKHEAMEAEKQAYLDSLEIKPPSPAAPPTGRLEKFHRRPTKQTTKG